MEIIINLVIEGIEVFIAIWLFAGLLVGFQDDLEVLGDRYELADSIVAQHEEFWAAVDREAVALPMQQPTHVELFPEDLANKTIRQLKVIARERNLPSYSSKSKSQLLSELQSFQVA